MRPLRMYGLEVLHAQQRYVKYKMIKLIDIALSAPDVNHSSIKKSIKQHMERDQSRGIPTRGPSHVPLLKLFLVLYLYLELYCVL